MTTRGGKAKARRRLTGMRSAPPGRYARRLSFTAILLLVLVLVAAAIAAGARFGVFDFMTRMFGASGVLPQAQELVERDLGSLELKRTTLRVEEAVYDGGALHVVYSITRNSAAAPLTQQETEDAHSDFHQALAADQVLTLCDSFDIDDVEYVMTNGSAGDTMIGSNNGELLCYLDIQLASAGIIPTDDFIVRLPVVGGSGEYRTLDFAVRADYAEFEPVSLHSGCAAVTLQSAFLSPVRAYLTLHIAIDDGTPITQADAVFDDWADAVVVDAQGNKLSERKEMILQNEADGWHATYEAHGRTVNVDIPVQVPQAEAFPALTAIAMPASAYAPFHDGNEMLTQGNESFANASGIFRWDTPSLETMRAAAREADQQGYSRRMDVKVNIVTLNELDWDTAYVYNNGATVRDTDAKMAETMDRFFPEERIRLTPHWVYGYSGVYLYDKRTDTFSGDPWQDFYPPLMVYFDQVIGGIPLLGTAAGCFLDFAGNAQPDVTYFVGGIGSVEGLESIGLTDINYSMQAQLLKTTGVLAADLPLCGFDAVMQTYEALITAGMLRSVDSLRLGYIAWQGKDDGFTLLPVWALEGELFQTAQADYRVKPTQNSSQPLEYGHILVNAQTGVWMDPWNGEENRQSYIPTVLTLDSIGE